MDIFELLGIVNKPVEETSRSITMDYIKGKIDCDTYIEKMRGLSINSQADIKTTNRNVWGSDNELNGRTNKT